MLGLDHITFPHQSSLQLLHHPPVPLADLAVVDDGLRVVHTNDTASLSLYRERGQPGLVDELDRYLGQLWDVPLDVPPVRVHTSTVDAGVQSEPGIERLLERRAGDPHPVAGTDGPVRVYHVVEEELEAVLPAQPEVAPGEEDAEGVPDDVVGPTLLLHLSHPRVNEGKARVTREISLEMFLVVKPGNVDTDGVSLHLSVERVGRGHSVEEFSPDERDVGEGTGRILIAHLLPGVYEGPVVFPHTEAAELFH